ncbi:hypothetical protein CSV86_018625 [Pseudomonas putida CSV86]|uniref:DUF3742 domain-containing protein n=1 Tax=Pseudomonas bharatica CSV86 TaxID=1005395 RepID=A0A7K4EI21_9PSED|nr:hypothetical protein [Pseudomonas bharatica]NNJ17050.1 hypothetical protein [Pseudomonas bharatica CSV86]
MTTAAKHSIASRLGRALGGVARFCVHDVNPKVRWVKRAVLAMVVAFILANSLSWLMSVLLTVTSLTLGLYALSKVDLGKVELFSEDEAAPYGRDVFERPLDSYGRSVK